MSSQQFEIEGQVALERRRYQAAIEAHEQTTDPQERRLALVQRKAAETRYLTAKRRLYNYLNGVPRA